MYFLKSPFALLATTFVTAVLATHIRRDTIKVTDLINALTSANTAVEKLNSDVQNFTSPTDELGVQNILSDGSNAANSVGAMSVLLEVFNAPNAPNRTDVGDSQAIARDGIMPLVLSLNQTASQFIEKENILLDFNFTNYGALVASLVNMKLGLENLGGVVTAVLESGVVEQLTPVISSVDNSLNNTVNTFGFPPIKS